MDFLVNLYARFSGLWGKIVDLLPLVGSFGAILGVLSTACARASASKDAASLLHSLHFTADEMAVLSLSAAAIKAHFNHVSNAARIDEHHEAIGLDKK